MRDQKVLCDFQFYESSFETDMPCLIMSQGRSLLRECVDVTLPLRPKQGPAGEQCVTSCPAHKECANCDQFCHCDQLWSSRCGQPLPVVW